MNNKTSICTSANCLPLIVALLKMFNGKINRDDMTKFVLQL